MQNKMRNSVKIIGVHPFGHDSAVAIIDHENKDVFGLSLERVTRFKHDYRFVEPLISGFFPLDENSKIVFAMKDVSEKLIEHFNKRYSYDVKLKPIKKILQTTRGNIPRLLKVAVTKPLLLPVLFNYWNHNRKFKFERDIEGFKKFISSKFNVRVENIYCYDHHFSHACSAYYFAPESFVNDCLIVTLDGQGDNSFSKVYVIKNNEPVEYVSSSNHSSITNLYSIFTQVLGFNASADEGKLEALACYGNMHKKHRLYQILEDAFSITEAHEVVLKPTGEFPFHSITGQWGAVRDYLVSFRKEMGEKDFSAVMQLFFEEFFLDYILRLKKHFGVTKMAFAGGGFANVKLNLRIVEEAYLDDMYIFPAMGDDGTAIGAAAYQEYKDGNEIDWLRQLVMPFFGNAVTKEEVLETLEEYREKVHFEYLGDDSNKLLAEKIAEGNICALFRDRMEFGPRALGHRSILANPLNPEIRDQINSKFKRREWFQPFCPSILETERDRLFEKSLPNKHMTCAFTIREEYRELLPSVVHVDGTARAQFVDKSDDEYYYNLIEELKKKTGFGVVLDTSFNIHGKTIVMTPGDALDDFFACGLDYLFIEGYVVSKK